MDGIVPKVFRAVKRRRFRKTGPRGEMERWPDMKFFDSAPVPLRLHCPRLAYFSMASATATAFPSGVPGYIP